MGNKGGTMTYDGGLDECAACGDEIEKRSARVVRKAKGVNGAPDVDYCLCLGCQLDASEPQKRCVVRGPDGELGVERMTESEYRELNDG